MPLTVQVKDAFISSGFTPRTPTVGVVCRINIEQPRTHIQCGIQEASIVNDAQDYPKEVSKEITRQLAVLPKES